MSTIRCKHLAMLMSSACLAAGCAVYAAENTAHTAEPTPSEVQPQLVRIAYLQGDVRISRGDGAKKVSKSDWGVAVAGLPIQTGYYLATGTDGRAEIEFEDASTVYLAENSVLAFNDLYSKDDVPYTTLALLTGTMTMHVMQPNLGRFVVETPTSGVIAAKDRTTYLRLTSFLNGFAVAARGRALLQLPDSTAPVGEPAGSRTLYFVESKAVSPEPDAAETQRLAAWDEWVDQRVKARAAAMAAVMKQSGIDQPLPGLADLDGKGTFFPCKPYGTCWVPNKTTPPLEVTVAAKEPGQFGPADPFLTGSGQDPVDWTAFPYAGFAFPCDPDWMFDASMDPGWAPFDWGMCSYGEWLPYNNGYAWVAPSGTQRYRFKLHHRPPVRWVRYGNKTGFVPLHPRDVAGKPPLNRTHGIFLMHGRQFDRVAYDPRAPLRELPSEPGRFLKPVSIRLQRAAAPRTEVRSIPLRNNAEQPSRGLEHARLTYDRGTQSFLLRQPVDMHGKVTHRVVSFAGREGTLQARAVGLNAHGIYNTQKSFGGLTIGRVEPGGVIRGGSTNSFANSGWSGSSNASFGGSSFGGGASGGGMPAASGGPVAASGGARK